MKATESRRIKLLNIRRYCMMYDLFTLAPIEQYNAFAVKWSGKQNLTTPDLCEMLEEILSHSNPSPYRLEALLEALNKMCDFYFEVSA